MEFINTIRFVPKTPTAANDPANGLSIAAGRVEPGRVGGGYDDSEFIIFLHDNNDTRYRILIKCYGLPPTDGIFLLNKTQRLERAIDIVRNLISTDAKPASTYQTLLYLASGIVNASGQYKNCVSACLKPTEWPELATEIPPDLPRTARGESVLCRANFS